MTTRVVVVRLLLALSPLLSYVGVAEAQIHVTEARIGCLDIQKEANLTALVGSVCNGKYSCSYTAPTPQQYTSAGVHAATRAFCTQAMEIKYQCGGGAQQTVTVPGDAWMHPPADLECQPPDQQQPPGPRQRPPDQMPTLKPAYIPPNIRPGQLQPINLARPPILETVYIPANAGTPGRVTSISYGGSVHIQPADTIELRLRAPSPSSFVILVNGKQLPNVVTGAAPPNPDDSGYFSATVKAMPGWPDKVSPQTDGYNWFFWFVEVKLPKAFRIRNMETNVPAFTLTVRAVPNNSSALPDLNLAMAGFTYVPPRGARPPEQPAPSLVFLSGDNSKNDTGWPHMPRAQTGIVARDVTVAGWLVDPPGRNDSIGGTVYAGKSEDWHFGMHLDPDFIQRNYPSADALPFAGAILPGQPEDQACWLVDHSYGCPCAAPGCSPKISLTNGRPPDVSSFLLPGADVDVELNAWHTDAPPNGRGPAPPGYSPDPDSKTYPLNAWAFNVERGVPFPASPAPAGGQLQVDDYIIVTGTLWEDIAHIKSPGALPGWKCFDAIYPGHGGWLEIHPVDVVRYVSPAPALRKHAEQVSTCANISNPNFTTWNSATIKPDPEQPPSEYSILRFQEIKDPRFNTGTNDTIPSNDPCQTRLAVSQSVENGAKGGYASTNSTFLVWWELSSTPRPKCRVALSAVATPVPEPQPTPQSPLMVRVSLTEQATNKPAGQVPVTLYDSLGRVQASGTTAADGTVTLKYAECLTTIGAKPASCGIAVFDNRYFPLSSGFGTPALSIVAEAQSTSGVKVTITDQVAKVPVQGATVSCPNTGSGTSAADGTVTFPSAECGSGHKLIVSKAGYPTCSFNAPGLFEKTSCP